jgi:hypothetical protein
MRNTQDGSSCERPKRPSGFRTYHRGQIGHVPRNVQAGDLSNAVAVLSKTANETVDHQTAMIAPLAEANEIDVSSHLLDLTAQASSALTSSLVRTDRDSKRFTKRRRAAT